MASEARSTEWMSASLATVPTSLQIVVQVASMVAVCTAAFLFLGVAEVGAQVRTRAGHISPLKDKDTRQSSSQLPTGPELPEVPLRTEVSESRSGALDAPDHPGGPVVSARNEVLPATADAVIEQMSEAAGAIFAGQVIAVRRPKGYIGSAEDAGEGIVEIDFRVMKALRGPRQGSVYTLREWAGLWAGNAERFRVGRQLLVFLRSPDLSGLSSPVHGGEGAIPLRGGGVAPGPGDTTVRAAEWLVDLRWVQTRALRAPNRTTMPVREPMRGGGLEPYGRDEQPASVRAVPRPWLSGASGSEMEPLSQVLQLCGNAMRSQHVPVR